MARTRARRTSPLYLPSAFDLFAPSRDLFIKYFSVFGTLYFIPLFFWLHSWVDTPAHGGYYWNRTTDANTSWTLPQSFDAAIIGFSILWFVIAILLGTAIQIMLQRAQLDAAEDRRPTLARSWRTLKDHGLEMLKLYLVMGVIIGFWLVPAIISFWLLPLIIPAFFMIRRYMFAPFVMLDKKYSVQKSLEESHRLSLINGGAVWGIIGVSVLIGLVGVLPLIGSLASFVLAGLYSIAPALRYQQLKKLG